MASPGWSPLELVRRTSRASLWKAERDGVIAAVKLEAPRPLYPGGVRLDELAPALWGGGAVARLVPHEAAVLRRLDGIPGVPKLYEAGEINGRAFLAAEWITPGATDARARIAGAARVLAAAHARGVIHRDVKPGNLVGATLVDWELALLDGVGVAGTVGTGAFRAPEAWDGEATAAGDIWSLGATARLWLQDQLGELVAAMLDPDPNRRPTAAEVVAILDGEAARPRPPARAALPIAASEPARQARRERSSGDFHAATTTALAALATGDAGPLREHVDALLPTPWRDPAALTLCATILAFEHEPPFVPLLRVAAAIGGHDPWSRRAEAVARFALGDDEGGVRAAGADPIPGLDLTNPSIARRAALLAIGRAREALAGPGFLAERTRVAVAFGEADAGAALAAAWMRTEPGCAEARRLRVVALLLGGHGEAAREVAGAGTDAEDDALRALVALQLGEPDAARQAASDAIASSPSSAALGVLQWAIAKIAGGPPAEDGPGLGGAVASALRRMSDGDDDEAVEVVERSGIEWLDDPIALAAAASVRRAAGDRYGAERVLADLAACEDVPSGVTLWVSALG